MSMVNDQDTVENHAISEEQVGTFSFPVPNSSLSYRYLNGPLAQPTVNTNICPLRQVISRFKSYSYRFMQYLYAEPTLFHRPTINDLPTPDTSIYI